MREWQKRKKRYKWNKPLYVQKARQQFEWWKNMVQCWSDGTRWIVNNNHNNKRNHISSGNKWTRRVRDWTGKLKMEQIAHKNIKLWCMAHDYNDDIYDDGRGESERCLNSTVRCRLLIRDRKAGAKRHQIKIPAPLNGKTILNKQTIWLSTMNAHTEKAEERKSQAKINSRRKQTKQSERDR